MKTAPPPADEKDRLEALRQTGVLDSEPEESFDQLTDLAARLCGAPVALITLVDVDRQWFKSCHGLEIHETPRDVAFCAHTILEEDLFVVPDTLRDERFHDNPLVAEEPRIRFYAGSPLVTGDGHALGSFCVIDFVPRELPPEHADALRTLARHAAAMLQLRRIRALLGEHSVAWERANRTGDALAKDAALTALSADFRHMVDERERAETELRRLEHQVQELEQLEGPRSARRLASALEPSLQALSLIHI